MYTFHIYAVNNFHHEDRRSKPAGIQVFVTPGSVGRGSTVRLSAVDN